MRRACLGLALVAVAACGGGQSAGGSRLEIVATTTILGDLVSNVVGNEAGVEVLMPRGADPHDYQPSSRQVAALAEADLVVANGVGLEGGLLDVIANLDGPVVIRVGESLDPLSLENGVQDPHFWLDPIRLATASRLLAAELALLDPTVDWGRRAVDYEAELLAAHSSIESTLAPIPEGERRLVTSHDALGYFASRYGFEIVGVVIPGGSSVGSPSSAQLADLVEAIRRERVAAVFADATQTEGLAAAVAAEAAVDVEVVVLYTGSLGPPGSGADSLIGMLLTNAELIAGALS